MITVSKTRTANTPTKVPINTGTEIAVLNFVFIVISDGIPVLVVTIICVVFNSISSSSVVEEFATVVVASSGNEVD